MPNTKIFVAGHGGMVGSSILRRLDGVSNCSLLTRSRAELDLTDQLAVRDFFEREKPDQVYLAAARVGGIFANQIFPADFIYTNLMIESNVIHEAWRAGVKKLLFLGSSCIYPKFASQPIEEGSLMTGGLEPTNEPYAIAKIAGIKLCESYNRQFSQSHGIDYRCVMPTNLYGLGDNYHPDHSHVIPALIRRFHEAKCDKLGAVEIWGSGLVRREFLFADDLAAACVLIMNLDKSIYESFTSPMQIHINVGSGQEVTIAELAELVCQTVGYGGEVKFDTSKPDGPPRKLLNNNKIFSCGWRPLTNLENGLKLAYEDYLNRI